MAGFLEEARKKGKRIVYLMGMTTDSFSPSSTLLHSLESLLLLQLRELGFRRVVYYGGGRKLHWLDPETARLCTNAPQAKADAGTPSGSKGIKPGPLGAVRLRKPASAAPDASAGTDGDAVQWSYGAMTDAQVAGTCKVWLKDKKIPTALIIRDTPDLLVHFDVDALRAMNEVFLDIQRADSPGMCVALFPQYISPELLDRRKDAWANLVSPMLARTKENELAASVLCVGPPDEQEIHNALRGGNLTRKEALRDEALRKMAARLARQFRFEYAEQDARAGTAGGLRSLDLHCPETPETQQPSAYERLEAMIGMQPVAKAMRRLVLSVKAEQARTKPAAEESTGKLGVNRLNIRKAKSKENINLHLALMGNPGTGKTHVARLIAEIYREEGLLESGHLVEVTRKDLVAKYVGQTAITTGTFIERAMGGVLFIDEAYQLSEGGEGDFGKEAVETVMNAMMTYNGHFAVIIAGYPDKMQNFILGQAANSGLSRRFPEQNRITFHDYSPGQLESIFRQLCSNRQLSVSAELSAALPAFFANWHAARDARNFGNVGDLQNLLNEMDLSRVDSEDGSSRKELRIEDVPESKRRFLRKTADPGKSEAKDRLQKLVGLASVKEQMRSLEALFLINRARNPDSRPDPGHYLFLGAPGTGKTTVARILGEVLREQGLLKKGHVVEAGRDKLVAGFQGQSALKTKEMLEEALDGILFIDEAYQLVMNEQDSFGQEAAGTLVAFMESHRDRLSIIAAGYPFPMRKFVEANSGLSSRFKYKIDFPNYTAGEMMEILEGMMAEKKTYLAPDAKEKAGSVFAAWAAHPSPEFANGRDVRNYLDRILENQALRLADEDILKPDALARLELRDIPADP